MLLRVDYRVLATLAGGSLGCAATTPSPPPAQETLIVLNSGESSLTTLPVLSGGTPGLIALGNLGGTPQYLAAKGGDGLIATGAGNTVARVGFATGQSPVVYRLAAGAGAAGAAFVNDSIAYVANPFVDRATRFNFRTGDTVSVATGHTPTAVAVTRGRVFIANANLEQACAGPLPCVRGPSWLTVIDPDRNVVVDSIPLAGPGNALAIEVGSDGLLYVLSAGAGGDDPGRLSIVDPVLRVDVGSFGGFGPLPDHLATDRRERLFVTSAASGLMEFNTRTRRVVRGAGAGIPLQSRAAVAVDDAGLIYAIESGSCTGGAPGRIRVFRPDLTEARIVAAGLCPVAATIVKLPPEPLE
jgi:hypothetical protein